MQFDSGCHHLGSSSASCRASATGRRNSSIVGHLRRPISNNRAHAHTVRDFAVVTSRHIAISNLRARATIMVVLRTPFGPSVLERYHCASALSFWNRRNRQASWIRPRRTRALPDFASPFSRLLAATFVRRAGQPGVACHGSSVAQVAGEHLLHQHVRRLDADSDDAGQHSEPSRSRRSSALASDRRVDSGDRRHAGASAPGEEFLRRPVIGAPPKSGRVR